MYISTFIIICIFSSLLFLFGRFSFTFRLPGASQQIYAICLAIYVLYRLYVYDNWCPHAIFSAFALQTVSDGAGRGEEGRGGTVKALALSLMNWNEWAAGVVGYNNNNNNNNTKAFSHTHKCTCICMHSHTRTHAHKRCPGAGLKFAGSSASSAAQQASRGHRSAAVVSLLRWVFGGVAAAAAAAAASLWRSRR